MSGNNPSFGERDDLLTTAEREELAALRKENAQLKRANEVLRTLVDEHPHLGVEPVLRELNIPSSTYYRWRQAEKEPCERRRRDAELTGRIRQVHDESGGIYGSPRVHAALRREGVHVGRKRFERLMREAGLAWPGPPTRPALRSVQAPPPSRHSFTTHPRQLGFSTPS
ncbi:IS3 family transposase [Streptomyces sp. NBC_00984]|uniref:IS3 family transposase n=1 Tax=Streptomyces sp. NBC_00984 TaxID=2903700 RepID=UPI00386ADC5A|nr:IS3 family transposase [Streptomyces sp. NBC_00984]